MDVALGVGSAGDETAPAVGHDKDGNDNSGEGDRTHDRRSGETALEEPLAQEHPDGMHAVAPSDLLALCS